MYKFDKENSPKSHTNLVTGNGPVLDSSGEALLENIEQGITKHIKGDGLVAKGLKGTIHVACWFIETDVRRRRFLRGEENPKERRFKL